MRQYQLYLVNSEKRQIASKSNFLYVVMEVAMLVGVDGRCFVEGINEISDWQFDIWQQYKAI